VVAAKAAPGMLYWNRLVSRLLRLTGASWIFLNNRCIDEFELLVVTGLLALPCGVGAIVGLYVLTSLFNWMAPEFSTYSISQGTGGCNPSGHCWSTTTGTPVGAQGFLFSACVVLLFVGAAVVNVLILRSVVRGRRSHDPVRPEVAEPHR
jgi:hypothetical protein